MNSNSAAVEWPMATPGQTSGAAGPRGAVVGSAESTVESGVRSRGLERLGPDSRERIFCACLLLSGAFRNHRDELLNK